jgi:hypothetical protein
MGMVLRRRTTTLLVVAALACTGIGLAASCCALWHRPETRIPALFAWIAAGRLVHAIGGERLSLASLFFASLFSLPMVGMALALYEAHERWGVSTEACVLAMLLVVVLFGLIFMRALVSAGSASDPYEDDTP